jgi:hypothetical protein
MSRRRLNRGLFRPRYVAIGDKRSPMLRLLQDGQLPARAEDCGKVKVAVDYEPQWKTLGKAMRLGYVDGDQFLTEKGREFIAREVTRAGSAS